jgi:hypothetical protein
VRGRAGLGRRVRTTAGHRLGRIQLRLRVIEVRLDPDTPRWVNEMRRCASDGTLAARVKEQPSVDEILDRWHSTQAS